MLERLISRVASHQQISEAAEGPGDEEENKEGARASTLTEGEWVRSPLPLCHTLVLVSSSRINATFSPSALSPPQIAISRCFSVKVRFWAEDTHKKKIAP